MSASSHSIKQKLQQDEIERIIALGKIEALFFIPKSVVPELEGDEWAIRKSSYTGFVELFRKDSSLELCCRFKIEPMKGMLQQKVIHLFDKEFKLTDLVVPESAPQCLNDISLAITSEGQQHITSPIDEKEIESSQTLQVIVSRTAPQSVEFESDFFISPEEVERKNQRMLSISMSIYGPIELGIKS